VLIEIGASQGEDVVHRMLEVGLQEPKILVDLWGKDRFAVAGAP